MGVTLPRPLYQIQYFAPLKSKTAAEVAYNLLDIILILGAPMILESDTRAHIVSKISSSGGQGFVHCQCKKGKCKSGRCICRRLKVMCNSRCHMSLSCSNK